MVVVCESCSTRFRVDGTRIPPKGTLVRCSRCKATFIVKASEASFEETVQDVVAEVTEAGGRPVPPPVEDLFERSGDDLAETQSALSEDDAWEFDEEPTRPPAGPALALSALEPADPEPGRREPAAPALDELGPPDDWDLLGESVDDTARAATFVEPSEPEPVGEVEASAPPPREQPAIASERRTPAQRGQEVRRLLTRLAATAMHATAWLALAAVLGTGVAAVLPRGAEPLALAPRHQDFPLPGGVARDVYVRFVENAFAGTLFVVQGELVRPSDPARGLKVYWRDAAGRRLGTGAWARPLPSTRELRERAPEAWGATGGVPGPAPSGGLFAAIFDDVPAEATGVELTLEPIPTPPATEPVATDGSGALEDTGTASGPGAAATASSPPSPRPSAE